MVHRCVINSMVMWLHILVGPCWCVYLALFRSSSEVVYFRSSSEVVYFRSSSEVVYFRTVQHTHTKNEF